MASFDLVSTGHSDKRKCLGGMELLHFDQSLFLYSSGHSQMFDCYVLTKIVLSFLPLVPSCVSPDDLKF